MLAPHFSNAAPVPPPEDNHGDDTGPSRLAPPHRPRINPTARPDLALGAGAPLPEPIRRRLEPILGFDLGAIRLHTDSAAGRLAGRYGARAFAYGSHVVFGRGEYAPHRPEGWRLLAHEVVHVVQQSPVAHDPWSSGALSTQARPRGPPGCGNIPIAVQHCFSTPRVQRLPSWDDVSNAVVDAGSAAVDRAVDLGSSAVDVAVDLGEGAVEVGAAVVERTAGFFIGLIDDYAPGLLQFLRGGFMSRLTDLFCRGLDTVVGRLISSLEDIDFVSALEEAFASAQGSVEGVIGAIQSGASSALGSLMQPIVEALDQYGPGIIDAITGASDSVNGFFDSIWESIGAPAMDFLGEAGGAIWREISDLIDWLWESTASVRQVAADAWDWIAEQFDLAWESTSGIREWIAEKATEAWDAMKEALGPLEGPITVLLGVLLVLSPLGPIVVATQVIPPLWEMLVWLWNNWNTDDILVWAQDTLRENILPGIISLVSGVASAIASAASWIAGLTVQAADAFGGVLSAFGANTCLATVTRVLNAVSSQFQRLAAWAEGGFTGLAAAIENVFHSIVAILQPILDFLVRLFLVVTNPPLLPFAIVGAVWLLIPDELKPPVINFVLDLIIAFLRGFPAFLTGLGPLASILKSAFLGFLQGIRGAEDQQKVDASNKVANLMAGAGLPFIAGFAVGILEGLIDGILDPFKMIWTLVQFLARLCQRLGDYLAPLLFETAPELGTAVSGFNSSVRATIPDHPPAHAPPAEESGRVTGTLTRSDSSANTAGVTAPGGESATLTRATPGSEAGPTALAPPAGGASATASPDDAAFAEIMGGGPTASDAAIVGSLSPGISGQLSGAAGELDAAQLEGETSAVSETRSEGSSVGGLASLLGGIWTAILEGAHSLGGRAAGALMEFIMLPDYQLGNKVGYVAGLVLLEVIIAYFSGGATVALKAAQPFVKAALRILDLGGEILGLLGRAIRPLRGPLLRGLGAAGDALSRFRFLQPIIQRIRRAADTLFHFGDEAAEAAGRAGGRTDDVARHADDLAEGAGRRADDAAGAGRRADDAADAGRHTDTAGDIAERRAAVVAARVITDANDVRDTPTPLLIRQLLPLRSRFRWIRAFEANWTGAPGRYRIVMRATPETIKEPYTTNPATPAEIAEHADDLPPGSLGDGMELDVPLTNPPDPSLGTVVGPNPNPAPPMRGDTGGRAYTSTRRTTRPMPPASTPEVTHVRRPQRSNAEFTPSVADEMALRDTHAARDLAGEIHRDLPIAEQGRTVSVGTGPDTPVRTSGGYTATDAGGAGRVEARAGETGHELAPHAHDPSGGRGRYHASHAEKQVITDSPNAGAGVSRDQCADCIGFYQREAAHQGRAIPVSDPSCDRLFHPDGSITEFWHHGPVVRYRPDGTVSAVPSRPLQPKLVVTRPGDSYEHEADRAAEAVTASGRYSLPAISAYREEAAMPAASSNASHSGADPSFERALDSGESGGHTLPASMRTHMEHRFGVDFSGVRVHTDGQAATLNRQVESLAFTTGRHIYFAPGQYRPGTAGGDRLLAHELTHVVQQAGGSRTHGPIQRLAATRHRPAHPSARSAGRAFRATVFRQVVSRPAARRTDVQILGDPAAAPPVPGMTLSEFRDYTREQADWFVEPSLAAPRNSLWELLLLAEQGPHMLSGIGDLPVSDLRGVAAADWPALQAFCRGTHSSGNTIRIFPPLPSLADRIVLGRTLLGMEAAIPPAVLKVTVSHLQLQQVQTQAQLPRLTAYWNDYEPHLEQTFTPTAGARGLEFERVLTFLNALGAGGLTPLNPLRGATPADRWVRNLHRFPLPMLLRLVDNLGITSGLKRLILVLHTGHDAPGAFQLSANLFRNLVLHSANNLVLMIEGAISLAAITTRIPTITSTWGKNVGGVRRISQVIIAGHGSDKSVGLAGTGAPTATADEVSHQEESLNIGGSPAERANTQALFDAIFSNMDPAAARILFAGCLVGSTQVPAGTAAAAIPGALAAHQSLGAFAEARAVAAGLPAGRVQAARASVALSAATSLFNAAGNLAVTYPFDPNAFGSASTYASTGVEPEGVLRAAVEVGAVSTVTAETLLRTRLGMAATGGWYDTVTRLLVGLALPPAAVPPTGVDLQRVNELANIAHIPFLALWPQFSIGPSHFTGELNPHPFAAAIYAGIAATPFYTNPPAHDTERMRIILDQGSLALSGAAQVPVLMAGILATALTADGFESFLDLGVLAPHAAALLPLGGTPTTEQIRLALAWFAQDDTHAHVRSFLTAQVNQPAGSPAAFTAAVSAEVSAAGYTAREVLDRLGFTATSSGVAPVGGGPAPPLANLALPGSATNTLLVQGRIRAATVTASPTALVRRGPGPANTAFMALSSGSTVRVTGSTGGWAAVDVWGQLGFIALADLSPPPP